MTAMEAAAADSNADLIQRVESVGGDRARSPSLYNFDSKSAQQVELLRYKVIGKLR